MPHSISTFEKTIVTFRTSITYCHHHQPYSSVRSQYRSSVHLAGANTLYRSEAFTGIIRIQIYRYLDRADLRSLRATSHVLYRVTQERMASLFKTVYACLVCSRERDNWDGFEAVAGYVEHIVITIGECGGRNKITGSSCISQGLLPGIVRSKGEKGSKPPYRAQEWLNCGQGLEAHRHALRAKQTSDVRSLEDTRNQWNRKDDLQDRWLQLLSMTKSLRTLTLRIHAHCPWPGRTEIEEILLALRQVLEHEDLHLVYLSDFRLTPVHALGLLHLNWQGFSVLGRAGSIFNPSRSISSIWTRLKSLEIHIPNPECQDNATPTSLTSSQRILFFKSLYHYLRAFTPTLQHLTFEWVGSTSGPCPLNLHLHHKLAERKLRPLQWLRLTELRLTNTSHMHQSVALAGQLAPELRILQTSRSGAPAQHGAAWPNGDKEGEWVDVLPDLRDDARDDIHTNGYSYQRQHSRLSLQRTGESSTQLSEKSSIYSLSSDHYVHFVRPNVTEEERKEEDEEQAEVESSSISLSSRDVTIMLDLESQPSVRKVRKTSGR